MGRFDFDLDLIDLSAAYLQFTYARIRRLYPEAAARVRLFHGNLPSYVKHVRPRKVLPGVREGMFVPLAANRVQYPH
jgi:hypothetical protein